MKLDLTVNGTQVSVETEPTRRLSDVLREDLGLSGTKIGCEAGDCGSCTVLVDGEPANACTTLAGSVQRRTVVTIEGLLDTPEFEALEDTFLDEGAAQCGFCIPGILVSAVKVLRESPEPTEDDILTGLAGNLCRCTGYRKIVQAVKRAGRRDLGGAESPPPGKAVGARVRRVDGIERVRGQARYGDDVAPKECLGIAVVRSPHPFAGFRIGDIGRFLEEHPGVVDVCTARDVPGRNEFGVLPGFEDQPVFAESEARYRGEAVAMIVGAPDVLEQAVAEFPISWEPKPPVLDVDDARRPGAPELHRGRDGNILVEGRVEKGDVAAALESAHVVVEGDFETQFVEHAYIEPEAGYAYRVGDRLVVHVTTQTPYMDRDGIAAILGIEPESVRVVPTAVGGGFGGKLDLSIQPFLALAAWRTGQPVRIRYTRPESMETTTKRHPARIHVRLGVSETGRLLGMDFRGDFNTGAYASWGPTVANRVPIHAGGPYRYDAYRALTAAVHTNGPPAGAFRGFGVPQAAIAQECMLDVAADALGIDPLEFRLQNALTPGDATVTGQVLEGGLGYRDCLEALKPYWEEALEEAAAFNASNDRLRRGVGVAGAWYGCGNTSLPNPSTMKVGLRVSGEVVLFQGAMDIGQGSSTVLSQICADALGVPLDAIRCESADTDQTPDAGKTSASRQTFISGNATYLAAIQLRRKLLAVAGASEDAALEIRDGQLVVHDRGKTSTVDLAGLAADSDGFVAVEQATYDPPTSPLDELGQGNPYAVYGYGAQLAELVVDLELGTVELIRITAAHDVGRAVNPSLVEGQIQGGIAQGIGLALMEEYVPGRSANLHDYLIPTIGDVPEIRTILVESHDPEGPYGAKGVGEHSLIPTAPAILNAIRHATGVRVHRVPVIPSALRELLRAGGVAVGSGI